MGRKMKAAGLAFVVAGAALPISSSHAAPFEHSVLAAADGWSGRVAAPSQHKTARWAVIEIRDLEPEGKAHTTRFEIALRDDGHHSHMRTHDAGADYSLTVRKTQEQDSTALLTIELERTQRQGAALKRAVISVSSRLRIGRPAVVGRIRRSDGGQLQLTATLRS